MDLPDTVTVGAMILFLLRVIWRATGRPRVEAYHEGLFVIGLVGRNWISAVDIRGISTDSGMTVLLSSGHDVSVFAFSASMVDRGQTERAASQMRRVLRKGAVAEGSVPSTRSPDFTWFDLVFCAIAGSVVAGGNRGLGELELAAPFGHFVG
ncbi:hypothetical protein ABZ778_23050 [Streptomyces bacillaris]|uniref:hypothetical protein n=1 Tax=Streptomyces bacillaris TaxID=68179 RepID=UPI00345F81D3